MEDVEIFKFRTFSCTVGQLMNVCCTGTIGAQGPNLWRWEAFSINEKNKKKRKMRRKSKEAGRNLRVAPVRD